MVKTEDKITKSQNQHYTITGPNLNLNSTKKIPDKILKLPTPTSETGMRINTTDQTIEIRVRDEETNVFHQSVLVFENSDKSESVKGDKVVGKPYWVSCLTESEYKEDSKEKIGISLGFFENEESNFSRSKITTFEIENLNEKVLLFQGDNDFLEIKNPEQVPAGQKMMLKISDSDLTASIKKPTSVTDPNFKPTRFY